MWRWILILLVALPITLLGSACTQAGEQSQEEAIPITTYFQGSPEEYTTLFRSCLEEHGVETFDIGDKDGFAVISSESDAYTEADAMCTEELGEPQMKDLPEDELRVRYEARVEQWECLVDEGFAEGEPISFDVFVEDYNRSSQLRLWEPTEGLEVKTINGVPVGPTDACPRVGAW